MYIYYIYPYIYIEYIHPARKHIYAIYFLLTINMLVTIPLQIIEKTMLLSFKMSLMINEQINKHSIKMAKQLTLCHAKSGVGSLPSLNHQKDIESKV